MALIAYLMEFKGNYGPHLIIVPNAVLVNWKVSKFFWPFGNYKWELTYNMELENAKLAEWASYLATIRVMHFLCWWEGWTVKIIFASKRCFFPLLFVYNWGVTLLRFFHCIMLYRRFVHWNSMFSWQLMSLSCTIDRSFQKLIGSIL